MSLPPEPPIVPESELRFDFTRSSGPGGQNVNKVNSKVQLRWNVYESKALEGALRERFLKLARNKISQEGELLVVSQRFRDQAKNIDDCREKLRLMLVEATVPPTPRHPTKPSKGAKRRRLEDKKVQSERKTNRRGGSFSHGDE